MQSTTEIHHMLRLLKCMHEVQLHTQTHTAHYVHTVRALITSPDVVVVVCVCVQWNTRHGEVLAHSQFYVPAVSQVVDFVEDFFHWINPKENVSHTYMNQLNAL